VHIEPNDDFPYEAVGRHAYSILRLLPGIKVDTEPGLADSAVRFAKYLAEFCQPANLREILGTTFEHEDEIGAMVIQKDIEFRGMCEHHLAPFFGDAAIGYIPNERVVGLSKLARAVQAAGTRRPSIQERITNEIADALDKAVRPKGVMVVIKALHTCMAVRGINMPSATTITSACRGVFLTLIKG
jgi:GTP cyclohydrolase I